MSQGWMTLGRSLCSPSVKWEELARSLTWRSPGQPGGARDARQVWPRFSPSSSALLCFMYRSFHIDFL